MPTSVRLDPKTERTLERLARRMDTSKSEVLRQAVDGLARRSLEETKHGSHYDRSFDLVGCVAGGAPDLSTRTGEGFKRLLAHKAARRT